MENNCIIQFKNVYKTFGSQKVLQGLDLEIPIGKLSFIIGRSGEGKSVTLKHIVGIMKPDSGSIIIDNKDMSNAEDKEWLETRKKIGLLFQDGALFDSMSVFENVCFPLREFTKKNYSELLDDVNNLLDLVGLRNVIDKFPAELSIGEKKRVGLARALAIKPKILLYDEPTTSMDPLVSELIDELIQCMQKKLTGVTSVVISHDVNSVLAIAEHILFLHEGKLYLAGSAEEFKQSQDPLVKQFLAGSRVGPLSNIIC